MVVSNSLTMIKTKKSKKQAKIAREIIAEVGPKQKTFDSDDEDVTNARVVVNEKESDEDDTWNFDFETQRSDLRTKNVKTLSEVDPKYQGKRVSRKSLEKSRGEMLDVAEHESAELGFMFEEQDEDDEDDEDSVASNRKKVKESFEFEHEGDVDYGAFGGGSSDEGDEEDADDSEKDSESSEGGDPKLLKNNLEHEVEKGRAIKRQLSQWDSLFECRIQMQKCMVKVNQFPKPETWSALVSGDTQEDLTKLAMRTQTSLTNLLDNFLELRAHMIRKNPEILDALQQLKRPHSDGEETSDDENADLDVEDASVPPKKLKLDEYEELLSKQHSDFKAFRNMTIEKWNDKTRMATGHLKSKSFSGFETSILQQVDHILADKSRLVRRTQLKRSSYNAVGECQSTTDVNLEEYDTQIFDDDDFYHQLLRELIERKTDDSDPNALGQQWLQIQRMRSKMKRKVDTKASKGRKTRFDIHSKLVNFMAPVYCESQMTDEAREELFKSLFGNPSKLKHDAKILHR